MENTIDYKSLGHRIQQARSAKELTQAQLGEICSLSTAHIGHIERGTRTPSLETICKIACTLATSIDYLLLDNFVPDANYLKHIEGILKRTDKSKAKAFMSIVKILAENIEKL